MSNFDKVTGQNRNELLDSFYEMVVKTYAKIGIPVRNKNELLDLTEWHVYPNTENPIMIAGYKKTPFGLKYTIVGSDGSPEGKAAVKESIKTLNSDGFYGELSHRLQDVAESMNIPMVPVDVVEEILNKRIQPLDEYRYSREITNVGPVEKVMFGKPNKIKISKIRRIADALSGIIVDWDQSSHMMCIV